MRIILGIIIGILVFLLFNLVLWRTYLRTRLKGYFLIAVGCSICTIGFIGIIISQGQEVFMHVARIGVILSCIGMAVIYTLESGSATEAMRGHSIFEMMTGNISQLSHKRFKPTVTKRAGIIVGILTILAGFIASFHYPLSEIFPVGIILLLGLATLVISIFLLPSSKREEPDSNPDS